MVLELDFQLASYMVKTVESILVAADLHINNIHACEFHQRPSVYDNNVNLGLKVYLI